MNTQIVVQKGNAIIPRKVVKKDVARLDWGGGGGRRGGKKREEEERVHFQTMYQ